MSRSRNPAAYSEIVGNTFLFYGIPLEERRRLLEIPGITVEHYEAGERIRNRETSVPALGIIAYGEASVEKRGASGKLLMSILLPGDLYGAAALFQGRESYVADILAAKSCWVISIPEPILLQMMQRDGRITENYLRYLTDRIRYLSDRIDAFAEGSVEERVMHYLVTNAEDGVFSKNLSLSSLAEALAISRTTLYRALDTLTAAGRIRRDQKTIYITKEEP